MGIFNAPLPGGVRSGAYAAPPGYPDEHFIQPSQVDYGINADIPGFHGVNQGPATWTGNTGDLFQESHNNATGEYVPGFHDERGIAPSFSEVSPAPGSSSLVAPRDANGQAGTNRLIKGQGPVRGGLDSVWTGKRAATVPKPVGVSGPVTGGQDPNGAAARAYYSQQASFFSQAAAEAAMFAAV